MGCNSPRLELFSIKSQHLSFLWGCYQQGQLPFSLEFFILEKESFNSQRKSPTDPKEGQRKYETLIGNAEACYLYALGPDAFHLIHECGDRCATAMTR